MVPTYFCRFWVLHSLKETAMKKHVLEKLDVVGCSPGSEEKLIQFTRKKKKQGHSGSFGETYRLSFLFHVCSSHVTTRLGLWCGRTLPDNLPLSLTWVLDAPLSLRTLFTGHLASHFHCHLPPPFQWCFFLLADPGHRSFFPCVADAQLSLFSFTCKCITDTKIP